MFAMPGARAFTLSPQRGRDGVFAGTDGVFVGGVPLLRRAERGMPWSVRSIAELNKDLSARYGLPVDFTSRAAALSLIATALNRGDVGMAAIATVQMQIPDPPWIAEESETHEEVIRRAAALRRSSLLKADWDPALHPRDGVPPNPGWFAPVDGGSEAAMVEPVAMRGPPWQKPEILEGGGGGGAPRGQLEFPSIRWPWSRAPSSAASGAVPKPSPPGDAQPNLPFPEGLPQQRAPAADADPSGEDSPTQGRARGGRLGDPPVRAQNAAIAAELESQGYKIIYGGGRAKEEYIPGQGPGTKGSTYVDITAVDETTGKTVRVQTVDTLADGQTPDSRERAAIARIREKFPNDELRIIPKR
jgi:hypothetical protein